MTKATSANMGRRGFLGAVSSLGAMAAFGVGQPAQAEPPRDGSNGRLVSLSRANLGLTECAARPRLGIVGIDLVDPVPSDAEKYGLVPTMVSGGSSIKADINDQHHAAIDARMRAIRPRPPSAPAIVLAGVGRISDEQGLGKLRAVPQQRQSWPKTSTSLHQAAQQQGEPSATWPTHRLGHRLCKRWIAARQAAL